MNINNFIGILALLGFALVLVGPILIRDWRRIENWLPMLMAVIALGVAIFALVLRI